MQNTATRPKTSCGQHRTVGYAFVAGLMVCRGCGLHASEHESIDETQARVATAAYATS